jgi:hypothetical protein
MPSASSRLPSQWKTSRHPGATPFSLGYLAAGGLKIVGTAVAAFADQSHVIERGDESG